TTPTGGARPAVFDAAAFPPPGPRRGSHPVSRAFAPGLQSAGERSICGAVRCSAGELMIRKLIEGATRASLFLLTGTAAVAAPAANSPVAEISGNARHHRDMR